MLGLVWWLARERPAVEDQTRAVHPQTPAEQVQAALHEAADAGVQTVTGVVTNEQGAAVPGAQVVAYLAQTLPALDPQDCTPFKCGDPQVIAALVEKAEAGLLMPPGIATTTTDATGTYSFPSLPSVDLHLVARLGARAGWTDSGDIRLSVGESASALRDGERPLPGLKVWAFSSQLAMVLPMVSDSDGVVHVPFVDEEAWIMGAPRGYVANYASAGSELQFTPPRELTVVTLSGENRIDATVVLKAYGEEREFRTQQGEVTISGLRADSYEVGARAPMLASPPLMADLSRSDAKIEFQLRAAARLMVVAMDHDGNPIGGARALLEGGDVAEQAEGETLLLGPVPEGDYSLSVAAEGRREVIRHVDLKPGENTIDVELVVEDVLDGVVLDENGRPAGGVTVEVSIPGGAGQMTNSEPDGRFVFPGPPGRGLTVTASNQGLGRSEATGSRPGHVELRLAPRGVLFIEFVTASGEPATSVRSTITNQQVGRGMGLDVSETGVARCAGLAAGEWVIDAWSNVAGGAEKPVTVVEGKETRVRIPLDPGVEVTGRLVDTAGHGVSDASLYSPGVRGLGATDEQGAFEARMPAGNRPLHFSLESGRTVTVEVHPPVHGLVVTVPPEVFVWGTVVDQKGAPVRDFEANGRRVTDPRGAFRSLVLEDRLQISAEGHESLNRKTEGGDLGVITLRALPSIEGTVVDPQGRLAGGVMVDGPSGTTVTDAAGRFLLTSTELEVSEPVLIVARRGAMSGSKTWQPGEPVRIALDSGTHVSGVATSAGKPLAFADVILQVADESVGPIATRTDDNGQFEIDLWKGRWRFTVVGNPLSRTLDVAGDRMTVALREEGACALELRHSMELGGVELVPGEAPGVGSPDPPGTLFLPGGQPELPWRVEGLPCGAYTLLVSTRSGDRSQRIQLRGLTVVQVPVEAPIEAPADAGP